MGISMFWTVGACFEARAEAEGGGAIPVAVCGRGAPPSVCFTRDAPRKNKPKQRGREHGCTPARRGQALMGLIIMSPDGLDLGWRWLVAVSSMPLGLLLLLWPVLPESPRWLVRWAAPLATTTAVRW